MSECLSQNNLLWVETLANIQKFQPALLDGQPNRFLTYLTSLYKGISQTQTSSIGYISMTEHYYDQIYVSYVSCIGMRVLYNS